MPAPATPARWRAAADEHDAALRAYLACARHLSEARWEVPWRAGRWTPAQITEHLTLAYDALVGELRDGRVMAPRLSPWRQTVSRWIVLPHILFHRSFPLRAPAPRELRPVGTRGPKAVAVDALASAGDRFGAEMETAVHGGGGWLTHPYFGRVDPVRAMRFVAVHLEHHRRQVERAGGG